MTPAHTIGTALITGASGGIGAVYADRLARRGHDLILVARDEQRLQLVAERVAAATGRAVEAVRADLTIAADQQRVERILQTDSRIKLLVNNAGVGATRSLVDSDIESLEHMIQLNVTALTRLAHAAAAAFVARGSGAIVNIGSVVALAPEVLNGTYAGTKAFVLALSQSLDHELSAKGIQIQVVLPGATSTDFWTVAGTPLAELPQSIVMSAQEMVDAALVGFDRKELVTIPSLPDSAQWEAFDAARRAMAPELSRSTAAARYRV
ncbi:MAG: SDR family oxidoreductase [Burkholderiaceae bacterium]|nr:SDR family oxidoreductase [Burkholderiaceae bacterium]